MLKSENCSLPNNEKGASLCVMLCSAENSSEGRILQSEQKIGKCNKVKLEQVGVMMLQKTFPFTTNQHFKLN